jgi:hypothetical protein
MCLPILLSADPQPVTNSCLFTLTHAAAAAAAVLQEVLAALFASQGFVCESMLVHARTVENRKSGVKMPRRWIQAIFRYAPSEVPAGLIANSDWEAASGSSIQQQQQQQGGSEQQQKRQRVVDYAAAAEGGGRESSDFEVQCAGRAWRLPAGVCSSSSSCVLQFAVELDRLLQQQQQQHLVLLGRTVLLLPPWLQLTTGQYTGQPEQQQQQQQQQLGTLLELQDSEAVVTPCSVCVQDTYFPPDPSSSSSSSDHSQYEQGAAAGLLALVAVWLGAKRVYACLPSSSSSSRSSSSSAAGVGAYAAGFEAVVQLNECTVVVERIRQRRWVQASKEGLNVSTYSSVVC